MKQTKKVYWIRIRFSLAVSPSLAPFLWKWVRRLFLLALLLWKER
jgi:hypothetical protein